MNRPEFRGIYLEFLIKIPVFEYLRRNVEVTKILKK